MSYIEKKYKEKIRELFDVNVKLEDDILELFKSKSIAIADKIAKLCALCNKNINQILSKYYPEIKEMDDKLQIKSTLKFYFDLIDKLTDFIRNVENFQQLDDRYYKAVIEFIEQKNQLISGKYKDISTRELTAFYDKKTRDNLEKILESKLEAKSHQFFTFGSLEEEIKKIAQIAGADELTIIKEKRMLDRMNFIENPKTIINYTVYSEDENNLKTIGRELKDYLVSKGFEAVIVILEFTDIPTNTEWLTGSIVTSADLNFY